MFTFFMACTQVNAYLAMKSFIKRGGFFMRFREKLAKSLFQNLYINDDSCTSPEKIRKIKISHILETAPAHATEYDKIVFHRKI